MASAEIARSVSPRGELVLLRRSPDGALELRVNGVFVMDSSETTTERQLAARALASWIACRHWTQRNPLAAPGPAARVLVAGLGLGYTLHETLRHPVVTQVLVAEIEPELVGWHRAGLMGGDLADCLDDARVDVVVADILDVVRRQAPGSVDVLILDVDNGPVNLVYDANAAVYGRNFLRSCLAALSQCGVVAIWSADSSIPLRDTMAGVYAHVAEVDIPVRLGRRQSTYTLLLGSRCIHQAPRLAAEVGDTVDS